MRRFAVADLRKEEKRSDTAETETESERGVVFPFSGYETSIEISY